MRIITDTDVEVFTDPDGDTLTLLRSVRHKDVVTCEEIESKETLEGLHELGLDMEAAMKRAGEATPEERRAARENIRKGSKSAKVRRFRLQAIARGLSVAGHTFANSAILQQYDEMEPASAAWVDEQVEQVWARATLDDAQREGPAPSAAVSADAEGAA